MKTYVKDLFDYSKQSSIPAFMGQREHVQCFHCGQTTVIAVPTTGIDWERVAKRYESYSREMWTECNLILSQNGCDTLLVHKLKEILEKIRPNLEGDIDFS